VCFQCQRIVCTAHLDAQQGRCAACLGHDDSSVPTLPDDEPIIFHCDACQAQLSAERRHAGRQIVCPKCGVGCEVPMELP
jgi:hypothetical protein